MCRDHALEPLPTWLQDELAELSVWVTPTRCLPPFGVHEGCEHDPDRSEPSFQGWLVSDPLVIQSNLGPEILVGDPAGYSQEITRAVREELERRAREGAA